MLHELTYFKIRFLWATNNRNRNRMVSKGENLYTSEATITRNLGMHFIKKLADKKVLACNEEFNSIFSLAVSTLVSSQNESQTNIKHSKL